MTVTESKLKSGSLILGTAETPTLKISCQATNVTIEPSFDDSGDAVEVLCGDSLAAATKTTFALKFTGIQDWTDKEGFINYSWDHDGESAPFIWAPTGDSGPKWQGVVTVKALSLGGDVNARLTSDAEWPCNGKPTRTDPVTQPTAAPVKPAKGE